MAPNPYPNLGFNPVEGLPADVEATSASIASAATVVGEANALLGRLGDAHDEAWRGEAGDAFRAHLDQTLSTDLRMASNSLDEALTLFRGWHEALVAMTEDARRLDAEAGVAREALARAEAELTRAQANPDLALAGMLFDPGEELQAAQRRLDAAKGAVRQVQTAVDECSATLESVLRQARELQVVCEAKAARVAEELTGIASRYAPSEPDQGILDRLGDAVDAIKDWYAENKDEIYQVLSTVSAASGVLALITPPPIDVLALGISVVTGAGVLAMDLSDPEVQASLGKLMQGDLTGGLQAAKTLGVDALGVLPGVGLAKGLRMADEVAAGAAAAGESMGTAARLSEVSRVVNTPGVISERVADASQVLKTPLQNMGAIGRHAADVVTPEDAMYLSDRAAALVSTHVAAGEYER
ncbi:hypothetical protein [Tomitella biformata]|uniref:hypothetical protein n=1 Tax=Tomitella biformata TaxID=630403 RepID=UPI0004B95AB4|nr:hypothetical protein [Tomitella biformata]